MSEYNACSTEWFGLVPVFSLPCEGKIFRQQLRQVVPYYNYVNILQFVYNIKCNVYASFADSTECFAQQHCARFSVSSNDELRNRRPAQVASPNVRSIAHVFPKVAMGVLGFDWLVFPREWGNEVP